MKTKSLITMISGLAFGTTLILAGCTQSSERWLSGKWHSNNWNVTYSITQSKDKWTIKNANTNTTVSSGAEFTHESNDKITLLDKSGTQYIINKIDNKTMKFQQVSKKGMLGTTDSVKFSKINS